jgi:hypothetical protein
VARLNKIWAKTMGEKKSYFTYTYLIVSFILYAVLWSLWIGIMSMPIRIRLSILMPILIRILSQVYTGKFFDFHQHC